MFERQEGDTGCTSMPYPLKIYSHKARNFKSVFYYYVHQFTY